MIRQLIGVVHLKVYFAVSYHRGVLLILANEKPNQLASYGPFSYLFIFMSRVTVLVEGIIDW